MGDSGRGPFAFGDALSCPANASATTGFMRSTIDVGIRMAADAAAYRELARFNALTGKTWNPPVLVGNLLIVRNSQEAACFQLTRDAQP